MIPLADPTGLAAHACGRALGQSVPMSVRKGFEVGEHLTVRQVVDLLRRSEEREVFARLRLLEQGSGTHLVKLNPSAVRIMLKFEEDHDAITRFVLDADGDLILEP